MALTCPSCRHPVEPSAEDGAQRIRCGNCGAWVPVAPVATPPDTTPAAAVAVAVAPLAQPYQPSASPQSATGIASLVCSLIFFVPLVTQALGLGFGVYALVRKAPDGRRPPAAWAGVLLSLLIGTGWTLLLVNFSRIVAGSGGVVTPYAGTPYGYGGSDGSQADMQARRRQTIESGLERIGQALAAYRRDMRRWPQQLDALAPTYLSKKVLDDLDPDRGPTANRLVTFLADVDPAADPPEDVVAYSVRIEYDDFRGRLEQPQRFVLRLNGQVEALKATAVEESLLRRGHRSTDAPAPE